MSESWSEQITAMWCMLPRFMTACYLLLTVTLQPLARDNRDDLYDTSAGCHGCHLSWPVYGHAVSAANQLCACLQAQFEGMGSEIPIKYASQVNCESNLFDVAYLALGEWSSSKFPRNKMPMGLFCLTWGNLLSQNGRLSLRSPLRTAILYHLWWAGIAWQPSILRHLSAWDWPAYRKTCDIKSDTSLILLGKILILLKATV